MSDAREIAGMLSMVGLALRRSVLVPKSPDAFAMAARMNDPQPGDLVVETSSFRREIDADRVGRLIRRETDDTWVIERLHVPGEFRWSNASFVALPDTLISSKWAPVPDPPSHAYLPAVFGGAFGERCNFHNEVTGQCLRVVDDPVHV